MDSLSLASASLSQQASNDKWGMLRTHLAQHLVHQLSSNMETPSSSAPAVHIAQRPFGGVRLQCFSPGRYNAATVSAADDFRFVGVEEIILAVEPAPSAAH